MVVKCIGAFPSRSQAKKLGEYYRVGTQSFAIEPGTEYLVFVLKMLGGQPWIEITDPDVDEGYLWGVPLCLFEIVNPRVSALWEASLGYTSELQLSPASLRRPNYHSDLCDGVQEVVADFLRVRQYLEQEADAHRRAPTEVQPQATDIRT